MSKVTRLPLESLTSENSSEEYVRCEFLVEGDLKQMLKAEKIQFATARIGATIEWHDINDCFALWKSEIQPHLVSDLNHIELSSLPEGYAIIGSLWKNKNGHSVVLLEVHH